MGDQLNRPKTDCDLEWEGSSTCLYFIQQMSVPGIFLGGGFTTGPEQLSLGSDAAQVVVGMMHGCSQWRTLFGACFILNFSELISPAMSFITFCQLLIIFLYK